MESTVRHASVAKILRELCAEASAVEREPDKLKPIMSIARQYAYALYHDIEASTGEPPVSEEMERRRGVPDDPEYFDSIDSIQEFLRVLHPVGTPDDKV
jgi:hypothetical protein